MGSEAQQTRIHVVDGDLDNLFFGDEPEEPPLLRKKMPTGDVYEAARAGDVERLKILLKQGVNVNARDFWDSVALYYACLAGHLDAARILLENGAICSEKTFDGDRCHYAALNLEVRKLLKIFEARPPPLEPLPKSLRELFLSSKTNSRHAEGIPSEAIDEARSSSVDHEIQSHGFSRCISCGFTDKDFDPDVTFYVEGQPIEAHRAILVARSPFFKTKFENEWRNVEELRFSSKKLSYSALFSLIHFFYTDRLDVAVEDMENLSRICKVCGCVGLRMAIERELAHQKYANYKHLRHADDSQKRFILQGSSLPEEERLSSALDKLLNLSSMKSKIEIVEMGLRRSVKRVSGDSHTSYSDGLASSKNISVEDQAFKDMDRGKKEVSLSLLTNFPSDKSNAKVQCREDVEAAGDASDVSPLQEDHADIIFVVDGAMFRSHQVILAARSEYFRARLSRMKDFQEGERDTFATNRGTLPMLQEQELTSDTFEKLLEYMYTDRVSKLDPNQAEEIFDAASRYLLFPLKRLVADSLLPHLETVTPAELCHWLLLADMYGVSKLREYCLDVIVANFEVFAATREFRRMLSTLPPPSGDSSQRTSAPSAPGEGGKVGQDNLLDDLREKWLEAEGAELDKRDECACQFDKRLELLVLAADSEEYENHTLLKCSIDKVNRSDITVESIGL